MGLMAFVAPFVLGMTAYGNYVIESTIVLVAAGIFEVVVVVTFNESNLCKRTVPLRSVFLFLLIGLTGLSCIFQLIFSTLIPVFLFIALVFRSSVVAINTRGDLITLPIMALSELLFSLSFIVCLSISTSAAQGGSTNLIEINAISQIAAGIPLLYMALKYSSFETSSRTNLSSVPPLVFSRLPEDIFYLLIPFLAGMKGGAENAAALRIVGSATKAVAKLIPIRYDTLLFYLKAQSNVSHIKANVKYIFIGGIMYIGFVLLAQEALAVFYGIESSDSLLLYSAPFVILLTILTPVVMVRKARVLIPINILTLFVLVIFAFFYFDMFIVTTIAIYALNGIMLVYIFLTNIDIFLKTDLQ